MITGWHRLTIYLYLLMEKLKKLARFTGLIVLIALALMGVGIGLALLPRRETFIDNETKIELVEGELEEEDRSQE